MHMYNISIWNLCSIFALSGAVIFFVTAWMAFHSVLNIYNMSLIESPAKPKYL
jgi:hypothetical protein